MATWQLDGGENNPGNIGEHVDSSHRIQKKPGDRRQVNAQFLSDMLTSDVQVFNSA